MLENKTNFALLQREISLQKCVLETHIAAGQEEVEDWCKRTFGDQGDSRLWMLKDAGANCADGLWVLSKVNRESVLEELAKAEAHWGSRVARKFVVQRYIERPKLWEGRFKFHCRMYVVMKANGGVDLYGEYLVHVANKPFQTEKGLEDKEIHITNTAVNKEDKELFHGCPVEKVEDLPDEARNRLILLLQETFTAALQFMSKQRSAKDFIHVGVDVMFDEDNTPFILECNVPPCAGLYGEKMEQSMADFFERMFIDIVRRHVLEKPALLGVWMQVCKPDDREPFVPCGPKETGLNGLSWAMYKRKVVQS